MNRREFLITTAAASAALGLGAETLAGFAQDVEWVRAWERAQKERPKTLSSQARIAPVGEPGSTVVIHGKLFQQDGKTPAKGICVFAYHTDRNGLYADKSAGPHVWRLRGWAESDSQGNFVFETIRPAPYPGGSEAAHIHITLDGPGVQRRSTDDIRFADDPLNTASQRAASEKKGLFGPVRYLKRLGDVQHVTANFRIEPTGLF